MFWIPLILLYCLENISNLVRWLTYNMFFTLATLSTTYPRTSGVNTFILAYNAYKKVLYMYEESCMINSLHPIKTHFVVDRALWTRRLGTVVESYCMRIDRGKPAKDDHLT